MGSAIGREKGRNCSPPAKGRGGPTAQEEECCHAPGKKATPQLRTKKKQERKRRVGEGQKKDKGKGGTAAGLRLTSKKRAAGRPAR